MVARSRIALVTGGAGSIGTAISERLAADGWHVAISYRSGSDDAGALAERLIDNGGQATAVEMDVRSEVSVEAAVARVSGDLGVPALLVNNAGIFPHSDFLSMSVEDWDDVIATDLRGPFLCSRAVARTLVKAQQPGSIINITSIDAVAPEASFAHYDAAKAGLAQLTRTMALELGPHGITVNAIGPGLIGNADIDSVVPERSAAYRTMSPLGQIGCPEDVAEVVAFLASDAARFITGQHLMVDGGVTLGGYTWAHQRYTGRSD